MHISRKQWGPVLFMDGGFSCEQLLGDLKDTDNLL